MGRVKKIGCVTIYEGDCLDVLPEISGVSGVLTDPPYGLKFMGKAWDRGVPGVPFWEAIRRACLPGAHLLAFGGTRTYHRQTCAIEDAGWLIRDCLMWVYGTGFPKSLDISKAIDKAAGVDREVVGAANMYSYDGFNRNPKKHTGDRTKYNKYNLGWDRGITVPSTPDAHTWQGYGTALKPALEPIALAQLPRQGTFVDNVLTHGCGALNIDGCRIEASGSDDYNHPGNYGIIDTTQVYGDRAHVNQSPPNTRGRWPSNLLIDDSEDVVGLFPSTGPSSSNSNTDKSTSVGYGSSCWIKRGASHNDSGGSAARFFYCAKASRSEREAGLEGLDPISRAEATGRQEGSAGLDNPRAMQRSTCEIRNNHPTVKPLKLMRYLVQLITQPRNNLILDPFAGSGSTGVACALAGLPCVLIEKDARHIEIIKRRVKWALEVRERCGGAPPLDLSPFYGRPAGAGKEPTDQGTLF